LLERPADVVLMNGFEDDFVPRGSTFDGKRKRARSLMLSVANNLLGTNMQDNDTVIIGTSGRYEFKNKGIDLFIEALNRVRHDSRLKKNILAYITVPGWVSQPREDLCARMKSREKYTTPLEKPYITHWLHDMDNDRVLGMMRYLNMSNHPDDKVKVIFVPCYLDGKDGVFNKEYYDVLLGEDLSVYASYYEPWGYTPLESVAFRVPTVTTDLAGFGLWVKSLSKEWRGINDGVEVLHRSDSNYFDIAENLKETIVYYCDKSDSEKDKIRHNAAKVAEKALWKHFIKQYYEAYDVALRRAALRLNEQDYNEK
jgi:glycosyltransferase involved in cell wall biosynthesis